MKTALNTFLQRLMGSAPATWLLLVLSLLLWGGEFVRRGLWEPDEARYACVAREMRTQNHWFVPHINGAPYPDKPPLMFWLINGSSLLTGGKINGMSARMPSLLGSLLTLWAMTRLLTRWHSAQAAWRAVLALLTTYLFWKQGGWGQIDALLCGLVMMSVYFLFTSLERQQSRHEALAYIFAGLAVLAKGPIGLVLPMGIFATAMLLTGQSHRLKRLHWLWGPLLAAAIPSFWLLMAWMQDAPVDYFRLMFGEKSFGRVMQAKGHVRPFYYFLWHFPVELLPWTLFIPAALAALSDKRLKRMLLGWIGFIILLFSLFQCKRNVYILGAYPAAAMLIGASWEEMTHLSKRWRLTTAGIACGVIWLLALVCTGALFVPQLPFSRLALIPTALLLLAGALMITVFTRRDALSLRWFVGFGTLFLLLQMSVGAVILPAINEIKAPITAARIAREALKPDEPIYLYRQQLAIFPLYANRPGREIPSPDALHRVIAQDPNALIVFREKEWNKIRPILPPSTHVLKAFQMGHKKLVLITCGQ